MLITGGIVIAVLTGAVLFVPEVRHMRRQARPGADRAGLLPPLAGNSLDG